LARDGCRRDHRAIALLRKMSRTIEPLSTDSERTAFSAGNGAATWMSTPAVTGTTTETANTKSRQPAVVDGGSRSRGTASPEQRVEFCLMEQRLLEFSLWNSVYWGQ
jgi:hypothetical protein